MELFQGRNISGTLDAMSTYRTDAEAVEDCRIQAVGLLFEVARTIESQLTPRLNEHALNAAEGGILIRLSRTPEQRLRMSDLASQAALSNSGLTRIIDRLVAAGLVRRETCEADRRVIYTVLTEEGAERVAALMPGQLEVIDQIFSGVAAEEADAFLATMRKIREASQTDGA